MYVGVCKLALWLLAAVVVFWIAGSYILDLTFVEGQGTVAAAVFLLAGASITGFFAWNILQLLPKTTPRASRLESVDEIKDGPDPSRWPGHAEQFFQQLRRGTEPNRHRREGWKHEATEIDNNTRVEGWWTAETQPRIEEHPVPTNISWLLIAGVGLVLAGLFLTTRPPNGTVLGLWDLGSVPSAVAYGLWVVQGLFFARAGTTALRSVTLLTSITRWRSVATFVHAEGTVNQESVAVGDADTDSVRGEVEDVSSKMMVRSWTATIVTESRGFEGTRRIIEMIDDSEAQQARDLVVEACERFAKDAVKAPEIDVDERTVKANLGIEGAREQARAEGRQAALEGSDAGPSDRLTEASAEDALPAGDVAFCPACGTEVGDKASFCSSCGEEIPS
jgi:hypothetical protein